MKNTKILGLFATGLLLVSGLTGCGGNKNKSIAEEAIKNLGSYAGTLNQVNGELQLPAEVVTEFDGADYTVTITWTGTPAERWNFAEPEDKYYRAQPSLPTTAEGNLDFTLKAEATYEGATASREFTGKLMAVDAVATITVAAAKEKAEGEEVSVKGIIAEARSSNGFYVCDTTGCIYVYTQPKYLEYTPGHEAIVNGVRASNTKTIGTNQVKVPQIAFQSYATVSSVVKPLPLDAAEDTTIADINGWSKDPTAGEFVNRANGLYKVTAKIFHYHNTTGNYYIWEMMEPEGSAYVNFYSVNAESTEYFGYTNYLTQYNEQVCEIYFVVYDINTSGSGNTTWRVVPLHIVPSAADRKSVV